MGIKIN